MQACGNICSPTRLHQLQHTKPWRFNSKHHVISPKSSEKIAAQRSSVHLLPMGFPGLWSKPNERPPGLPRVPPEPCLPLRPPGLPQAPRPWSGKVSLSSASPCPHYNEPCLPLPPLQWAIAWGVGHTSSYYYNILSGPHVGGASFGAVSVRHARPEPSTVFFAQGAFQYVLLVALGFFKNSPLFLKNPNHTDSVRAATWQCQGERCVQRGTTGNAIGVCKYLKK